MEGTISSMVRLYTHFNAVEGLLPSSWLSSAVPMRNCASVISACGGGTGGIVATVAESERRKALSFLVIERVYIRGRAVCSIK
jgi:hypothetical protein